MSSKAAFINGKQALAASLKSLSLVSSFFLVTYTHHVLQFNEIAIEGTPYTKASLAAAMAEEWNISYPQFGPVLIPLITKAGDDQGNSLPDKANETQSTGVPDISKALAPVKSTDPEIVVFCSQS